MRKWYSKEYFDEFKWGATYRPRTFNIRNAVKTYNPKTILDVGCGTGIIVKKLRDDGFDAVGIDFSPDAGKDIPGYFKVADIMDIPYPDNSFDMVLCMGVLEHIREEDIDQAYSEMKRVGGKIIASIGLRPSNYFIMKNGEKSPEYHITIKPMEWWEKKVPEIEIINNKKYAKSTYNGNLWVPRPPRS